MYEIDGQKANKYYELGQQKPFACMSLKPGLGDTIIKNTKLKSGNKGISNAQTANMHKFRVIMKK